MAAEGKARSDRRDLLPFSRRDLALLEVARDDPAGQAKFEAYTLALALNTWQRLLQTAQGRLAIRGDALGILHDVLKLKAREPKLNALAHQIAYILAPHRLRRSPRSRVD